MPQANPMNWILHSNITATMLIIMYSVSFHSTKSKKQSETKTKKTQHQWKW